MPKNTLNYTLNHTLKYVLTLVLKLTLASKLRVICNQPASWETAPAE